MFNTKKLVHALAFAAAVGSFGTAYGMQTLPTFPAPNCGTPSSFGVTNNCITYGDFAVYSLNLLYVQDYYLNNGTFPGNPIKPGPGDPFYVNSTPGELGKPGYIVYGTGPGGQNVVTNGDGTLIDNAQDQPNNDSADAFVVGTATETKPGPGPSNAPGFTGDLNTSWDATLSAMRAELVNGSPHPNGELFIYFNLNEIGTDGLDGIDMQAWFKVTLEDLDGGLPMKTFILYGEFGDGAAPAIGNAADPNWVYVHGTICVSSSAGFLGFGPCNEAQILLGGRSINQNLGAQTASFAIYNKELSNLALNSGYDILRGNWQKGWINNGFEQEFSGLSGTPDTPPPTVPEPSSLALLGLGVLGMAALSRRRAQACSRQR